jgi:ABC-type amino acid transport substrate-binding protein/mono/diheme cytochrome c family protein
MLAPAVPPDDRQPPSLRRRGRSALLAAALVLATALPVGAAVAATALPVVAAREKLRVCADPDNLPFSSAEGAVRGLSLEIAQLVADALGRPLEPVWTVTIFGKRSLRTTLLAGQCDAFVGLPETADFMGKRLIYSQPLFTMGYALAVPADRDVRGLAELDGKRVGVQFATPPQSLLATRPAVTSVTFMDPGAAMAALARGEIDAAFVWGPIAGYLNTTTLGQRFHVVPVASATAGMDMQWPVGIGFARGQAALRDEVDHALAGLGEAVGQVAHKYGLPTQAPVRFAAAGDPRFVLAAANPDDQVVTMEQFAMGEQLAMARPTGSLDLGDIATAAAEGRSIFNATCAHCHGPNAEQAVTRINLRLLKHRYGEKMDELFITTVTHGRPSKGMPNWSGILSDDDFVKIRAFLHTVQQND